MMPNPLLKAHPRQYLLNGTGYLHLLFRTGPTAIDLLLFAGGLVAAIAAGVPFPILGILFGQLVDDLNSSSCDVSERDGSALNSTIVPKVLLMIYVSIANFVAIYIHSCCWSWFGERLVDRLRRRYFRDLLQQDMTFFDRLASGDIPTRLNASIEMIRTGTSEKVGIFISSCSYFVGAYIVAFIKVPRLAAMLIFLIPCHVLLVAVGSRKIGKYTERTSEHLAMASKLVSQSLMNITLVHALSAATRLEDRLHISLFRARREAMYKAFVAAAQFGGMYFLSYAANALAFWQGSRFIASAIQGGASKVSVGDVYTVIFVLLDASFVISQVAPFLSIFGSATASARSLSKVAKRDVGSAEMSSDTPLNKTATSQNDVIFHSVSFSYPSRPEYPVLKDASLTFKAGQTTAIVGPSGSGKSTIRYLLARLYDPDSGSVRTEDGKHLSDVDLSLWRSHLGVVDQEPDLFNCSIFENLALGLAGSHLDATVQNLMRSHKSDLEEVARNIHTGAQFPNTDPALTALVTKVIECAIQANADGFIRDLSQGYATIIGSAGSDLSGGQKQRIALARALIRDPEILLLDEATSALDSQNEQIIQSNLQTLRRGKTTIIIAHRLATVKTADKIIVFKDGRVVEEGQHDELISRDGLYTKMTNVQSTNLSALVSSSQPSPASQSSSTETAIVKPEDTKRRRFYSKSPRRRRRSSGRNTGPQYSRSTADGHEVPGLFNTVAAFSKLARPYFLWIILGFAGAILVGGSYSADAVVFGHTIGNLNSCRDNSAIRSTGNLAGLLFFMLAVVTLIANIIAGSALGRAAESTVFQVRILTFRSLLSQNISWHFRGDRTPATLLSNFTADTAALAGLSGTVMGTIFIILTNLVVSIIMTHIIAWKIAIVLLATIPILIGSGYMRLHVIAKFQAKHEELYAESSNITLEVVHSMKTIASFNLEQYFLERYRRSLVKPYRASLREIRYTNFWLATAYSISTIIYALAYWWGSRQIAEGTYSQTKFFIVLPALLFSAQSCGQILALAPDISNAQAAATRLLSLINARSSTVPVVSESPRGRQTLNTVDQAEEKSGSIMAFNRHGTSIKIENTFFSHPSRPQSPILQGLSFMVEAGQFCALVGPSGAGKSTILALLERFYDPDSGCIELDGHQINIDTDRAAHRSSISYVQQDSILFDETVQFNISLGARPGDSPTLAEIEHACQLAGIHEFILSLPEGYRTLCGDRFSGGQKQRLCIARALVRRPRLLLLDEPTSALDTEAEAHLKKTIENVKGTMTVLVVAHRLHTVQDADRIFVIEDGRCTESGTHAELMTVSKRYKQDVIHQALG